MIHVVLQVGLGVARDKTCDTCSDKVALGVARDKTSDTCSATGSTGG